MDVNFTISRLITARLRGDISDADNALLEEWINASDEHSALINTLENKNTIAAKLALYDELGDEGAWKKIMQGITKVERPAKIIAAHRVRFLKTAWFKYAAAILLILATGAYLWLKPFAEKNEITSSKPVPAKNDIQPGGNKAILQLADGSAIILDDAAKGTIAEESGATIKKTSDGNVEYSSTNNSVSTVSYNTMSTPRGGQYQLVLPDGSKVWLNAESSITFPTTFITTKREVKITGEAYFEIAKNKKKPFIVTTGIDEITVLGTAFNVNAYPDETNIKTSLIEGSVKVNNILLKPGQAFFNEKIINTNISQDIAWKNNQFDFENLNLEQAMRQLSRWYNVEVKYKGTQKNFKFTGKIWRTLTLNEVIEGLSVIEDVNFELEGKVLKVSFK